MADHIKISPELEWIRPFIRIAGEYVNTNRIKSVTGFAVPLGKSEQLDAHILVDNDTHKADLMIRVMNHYGAHGRITHRKPSYISEILDHLAHELAHLSEWEHTPTHFFLQHEIMKMFSCIMEKHNITDTWKRISLGTKGKWSRHENRKTRNRIL